MTARHTVQLTANFERNLEELEAFLAEADAPVAEPARYDEPPSRTRGGVGVLARRHAAATRI